MFRLSAQATGRAFLGPPQPAVLLQGNESMSMASILADLEAGDAKMFWAYGRERAENACARPLLYQIPAYM